VKDGFPFSSFQTNGISLACAAANPMASGSMYQNPSSHMQEYCLLLSFMPTKMVASYCGAPLLFFSRASSWICR
jgi:hypothetical protein